MLILVDRCGVGMQMIVIHLAAVTNFQNAASRMTTVVEIPTSSPAALADFLNSDLFQLLNEIGK